jgi:hypothetical protein
MVVSMMQDGPKSPPAFVLIIPLVMAAFGFGIMHKLVFDLMDSVYDAGDHLVLHFKGQDETVPLSNIINVSHTQLMNPPRITLTLRQPCRFGTKVAFCPATSWVDYKSLGFTNAIADELIDRADKARSKV